VGSLKTLTRLLESAGVKNFEFDPNLMRGFDYYTDIVFEVFDTDPENNRSMFGGGRYDGLVGLFGVEPIATIGFGMGDVTLANFLESRGLLPDIKPETKVYVALVGDVYEKAASLIDSLRKNGINVAVDYSGRKLGVQIATAQKKKINQVLITGDQEISAGLFTLRNIYTSDEIKLDLPSLIAKLKEQ
jgi:histidyl-tRNA synthetase